MEQQPGSQSQSEQVSEDNIIGGRIVQSTDASASKQSVMRTSASELKQSASSQRNEIRVGKLSGTGLYAVIGVVIIVLAFLIVKYFFR